MNTSFNLILIGAGGHARSCIEVIEQEKKYRIVGLVGLEQELGYKHLGYEVIATDKTLQGLSKDCPFALISVGQILTSELRIKLYIDALNAGFKFPTIISPKAYVSPHATIGKGSIVMHGAVINSGVIIGENCIINTNSLVEHDSKIDDHCHISTGAILNGEVLIQSGSFIGSGSIIRESITVGANSIIGMGLTVRTNISSNSKFLGEV